MATNTMTDSEWRAFLSEGIRTAKLAAVRPDGRPMVVPVWFILDDDGQIRFQTGASSAKVRAMRAEPRVCVLVEDATPPFSFVMIDAVASVIDDAPIDEMWRVARACGARYMGEERADEFAARNAVPGECLVELRVERVVARRDVSA